MSVHPGVTLEWEGPDEDGDLIVTLRGVPHWHLAGHGKTVEEALGILGEAMVLSASLMTVGYKTIDTTDIPEQNFRDGKVTRGKYYK